MPLTEGALPAPTLSPPGADREVMRPRPSETRAQAGHEAQADTITKASTGHPIEQQR